MKEQQASCLVVSNPLMPELLPPVLIAAGTRIKELDPKTKFPAICRVDGQWLLRKDWDLTVLPGQKVEFFCYPQGGGGGGSDVGRTILMIAAVYFAVTYGGPAVFKAYTAAGMSQATATAIAVFTATTLVNALVPVNAPDGLGSNGTSASPTYTANLAGNQSRLDEPIPVLYGRNKTFPNFAAEPYSEYPGTADDQYFNALLCLGQGEYTIESINIDDTNIDNFQDIEVRSVLPPGTLPSVVSANIVNAPEVTGNEVLEARYTGPFIGCRPKAKATKISIDIGFSRGLATYNSTTGEPENKTVTWRVEYRAVDDFGAGSTVDSPGAWTVLQNESLTAAQTEPLRRTYDYVLPTACRPQVRVIRTNPFDDNSRVANTLEWIGLRCHLQAPAPLCSTATHIEIRMRASEQLSGLTQRKIAVISRRKLRTWHPDTGWSALQETRNPAWALADKWTNPVYGDGYADDRCDLQTLYDLSLVWDARQDRFDGVFDQTYDSNQADQMIAQAGRAVAFRRNTLMTVSRDQLRDLPVTAFTARNIAPNSVSIDYHFTNESTPDGVIVEYWDNRGWDWAEITVPAPGVTTPVRPHRLKLFGITGATHAEREGRYHIANAYYRRKYASFSTELEGMIPAFGSAVVFAPSLPGWGKGGDVVSVDETTLEAQLTEPPTWVVGATHYISFLQRDGSMGAAYAVTQGSDAYRVILPSYPAEYLSTDNAGEERTKYVFGASTPYPVVLRVLSVRNSASDSGVRSFSLSGVIEDDRVHEADLDLLPDHGVVQDPVDGVYDPPVDGSNLGRVVHLPRDSWESAEFPAENRSTLLLSGWGQAFGYQQDGLSGQYGNPVRVPNWWLLRAGTEYGDGPFSPGVDGALFEVRATHLEGELTPASSPTGSWLSLASDRLWQVSAIGVGASAVARITLEIRDVATSTVQYTAENLSLSAYGPMMEEGG